MFCQPKSPPGSRRRPSVPRNPFRLVGAGLAVLACVAGVACSSRLSAPSPDPDAPITVFAASSLTGAFREIAAQYAVAHPQRKVTLNFGASSELVAQMNEGAPADVFASADAASMGRLESGTVGEPAVFATNRLEIIVASGNPKGIRTLADLARNGIVYIAAAPEVPIGAYAQQVLAAAGVVVSPRSLERNVKAIVSKVTLGEADAGIVYVTDVLAAGQQATGVEIPDALNVVARYPIAVPATSRAADSAASFVAFVRSTAGLAILAKYGFGTP